MRFNIRWSDVGIVSGLYLVGFVIVGGVYSYIMWSASRLVSEDAKHMSVTWGSHLASNLNDIDQILKGQSPSKDSLKMIGIARSVDQVYRVMMFDSLGNLKLVSDHLANVKSRNEYFSKDKMTSLVLEKGKPITILREEDFTGKKQVYAVSYVPVMRNGKVNGVIQVSVDETLKLGLYKKHLTSTAIVIIFLMIIVFSIPSAAYHVRTREKLKAEARVAFLAQHDNMTGLMNRNIFLEGLDEVLIEASKKDKKIAVHYIDVDRFKEINDTLGHDIGDKVIVEVAERLREISGDEDLICRPGGDEFVIAQTNIYCSIEAEVFADKIVNIMRKPFKMDYHDIASGVSIGIAMAPEDGVKGGTLLKRADLALYRVKTNGRDGFMRFEPEMDVELEARRKLENIIRNAAVDQTFVLNFQPLYKNGNENLIAFEALLRLPAGEDLEISPAVFVPIAEDMGLINEIGAWVIDKALSVAASWPDDIKVAINLSPLQFKNGDLVGIVREAIQNNGVVAGRVELEITEGLLLTDTEGVMEQLAELQALGVSIVMDDFGTGYSSLSYLWQFPFDKIKIDRSFISALENGDESAGDILETIVSLGHSLNMSVTAEGVETVAQAEFLKDLSCDNLQGFYFGRPMAEVDLAGKIINDFNQTLVDNEEDVLEVAEA